MYSGMRNQTFRFVLQKITAWVIVRVSYRSHRVSNFHSSLSTATKNCLMPCNNKKTKIEKTNQISISCEAHIWTAQDIFHMGEGVWRFCLAKKHRVRNINEQNSDTLGLVKTRAGIKLNASLLLLIFLKGYYLPINVVEWDGEACKYCT